MQYVRTPRCTRCNAPITRVDWYRMKIEWEAEPCNCGAYAYPHARGRGACVHNVNSVEPKGPSVREDWTTAWRAARMRSGSSLLSGNALAFYDPACDIAWTRHHKPYWLWPIAKRLHQYKALKRPHPDDIPF
jgi:hypothetical protein